MNIFDLIAGNVRQGPQALRFPKRRAPIAAYRGDVVMDADRCLVCGICAYVCVSRAIALTPTADGGQWTYDPAACTYCGRCVDHCPGEALAQAPDRGASYGRPGELVAAVTITYPACPECGEPAMPVNEALLGAAFREVTEDLRQRVHLCERCRRKATVSTLKKAFGAVSENERTDDDGR